MSNDQQSPIEGNRYFLELGHVPESMTLLDIWAAITERKWFITIITLIFVGLFAGLGMMAPTKYKAEVVVAEANPMSNSSSSNSSDVDLDVQVEVNEALSLIESRQFLYEFLTEEGIIPVLFINDWDSSKNDWKEGAKHTLWDAYDTFEDHVLDVETDDETGLITVSMLWTDAEVATRWANDIVDRINAKLRTKAIDEATRTLEFLNKELQQTTVVEIQESLYDMVKTQKAKIVAANVHDEYAFKIMDPAVVPEEPAIPYLLLILIAVGAVIGMFIGVTIALLLHLIKQAQPEGE